MTSGLWLGGSRDAFISIVCPVRLTTHKVNTKAVFPANWASEQTFSISGLTWIWRISQHSQSGHQQWERIVTTFALAGLSGWYFSMKFWKYASPFIVAVFVSKSTLDLWFCPGVFSLWASQANIVQVHPTLACTCLNIGLYHVSQHMMR